MHLVQTIANSKFCCHVYFFLHVVCYTSKLLCCKKGIVVMIDFFGVAKISFFFLLLWVVHKRIKLCNLRCCGYPIISKLMKLVGR
jgi:hypothetical protein